MDIDWNIAQNALAQPDPGQRFAMGMQLGQQQRQQRETREALGKYGTDPDGAINQLMPDNPGLALQLQNSRAQQQRYAAAAQDDKQKQVAAAAKVLGPLYRQMAQMPYEQRKGFLQQIGPRLAANGIPSNVISAYDPTDENLQADMALTESMVEPELVVIDGVAIDKRTGKPQFESPYPRIVSGAGGVYEQPRIGIGRGGAGAAPAGHVVNGGLPPGWTVIEDDEGGPSPGGSATFP